MKITLKLWICLGTVFSVAGMAHAAGYQLNEYSASSMGRSFAGMGIVGDDFSAIGYNPAGMTVNQTSGAQFAGSMVQLRSTFKGYGMDGNANTYGRGHTDIYRVLPSGFVQYKVSENLTTGIGFYTPFGLATDYPNGWFGEDHGGLSEITVMDISPAIAYRVNEYLSLGTSVNFQYVDAHLTSRSADLRGHDFAAGYSVGMTITPIKQVRFGLSYRSKVSHHLKGDLDRLTLTSPIVGTFYGDVGAKITTPETVVLSGAWDVNEHWTLSGTARWTRWKRFDVLNIDLDFDTPFGPQSRTSSTSERWRNTGFYALGADYKPNKEWTIRSGIGYDMTVIRSAAHRTPRIPDGRRAMGALGVSYLKDKWQLDVGYAHIWVFGGHARGTDDANMAAGNRPNIKYSSTANMFSVGLQYKF